ncbi:MAG: hypothetical protein PHX70_08595 [Clostridium sp.]|nr:hypothetical protein [Clostridium sp.]
MASRRIYITLNSEKEKDRIITEYLSSCYSEKDAIKEAVYRLAIINTETVQKGTKSTERVRKDVISNDKVQNDAKSTETVKKKSVPKRRKEHRNGANNTKEVQNGTKSNEEVQNGTKSNEEVQNGKLNNTQNDDVLLDVKDMGEKYVEVKKEQGIEKNELEQLKKFI